QPHACYPMLWPEQSITPTPRLRGSSRWEMRSNLALARRLSYPAYIGASQSTRGEGGVEISALSASCTRVYKHRNPLPSFHLDPPRFASLLPKRPKLTAPRTYAETPHKNLIT